MAAMACACFFVIIVVFGLCWSVSVIAAPNWAIEDKGCRTPERGVGDCENIHSCKPMADYLASFNGNINTEVRTKIRAYHCGVDSRGPKVCCPRKPILDVNGNDGEKEDKSKLLPLDDCGITPNIDKIVNGQNASLYEFPWMAALMYSSENGPKFKCGGSLINKRYVLTAAHCIGKSGELVQVRLGEYDLSKDRDCVYHPKRTICAPPVQNFDVTINDAIVHQNYNSTTLDNDIALIRLKRDANLQVESVKPICLPVQEMAKRNVFKKKLVVSGWGKNEKGVSSLNLLKVFVPAVANVDCTPLYKPPIIIKDEQMCAGGQNSQNTCDGDSGGPLMQQVSFDGQLKTVQYGIVSAGSALCEKRNFPVRYTRMTSYVDWVLDNIKP